MAADSLRGKRGRRYTLNGGISKYSEVKWVLISQVFLLAMLEWLRHIIRPSEIQFSDGLIVYIALKSNSQTQQLPVHGRWGVLGRGFLGRR